MITHKCTKCLFIFSQADKAWDVAVLSKQCPKCNTALVNFNVPIPSLKEPQVEGIKENQSETIENVFRKRPIVFFGSIFYSISFITSLFFGETIFWSQKHMGFVSFKESREIFFFGLAISSIIFFFTVRWLWRYYKANLTPQSSGSGESAI